MPSDLAFYAVAIPAVLIFGISKGGFGGGLGIAAVPLMALAVSPAVAAGILLPLLMLMDAIGVWAYRRRFDHRIVRAMLPGALAGITSASLAFHYLDDDLIRVLLGLIATGFAADYFLRNKRTAPPRRHSPKRAAFWGGVAGFTSTVAHAGGPSFQIYVLPQQLPKMMFAGTSTILFALLNLSKVPPYIALGLMHWGQTSTILLLAPVAVFGAWAGYRLTLIIPEKGFFVLVDVALLAISLMLIQAGLSG